MAEHRSSVEIAAVPDRVFDYLTTDTGLTAWLGTWAEVEPVPGGRFAVEIAGHRTSGVVLEVDPPRRLTVSWGFVGNPQLPPGASTVSFALSPTATGTHVELVHTDLPPGEIPGHADGWAHFLPRLHEVAAGRTVPPSAWHP